MAFDFESGDPVLDLGPRRPKEHRNSAGREYMLWPGWSYRVVAPIARIRRLNVFQRAVLGLCKAERQDFGSIGKRLSIHPNLAAFILAELSERGFVDDQGLATDLGSNILDEDFDDVHDMVAGHVFQDPWSGELWPRFQERLNYCDLQFDGNGFPNLLVGAAGKPRIQRALMVLPNNAPIPARPSTAEVVSAAAFQQKAMHRADFLMEREDNLGEIEYAPSRLLFDRVSFMDEKPTRVFLMTYLYITDSHSRTGDWYACDPFGFGVSIRLRRRVEQVMQESPGLRRAVRRMLGRDGREWLEEQKRRQEHFLGLAKREVERRLPIDIRNHDVFKQIVDMELARQEATSLGEYCPKYKIHSVLRACLKCLEAVFGGMAGRHPLGDAWKRVYVVQRHPRTGTRLVQHQDPTWLAATYGAAAATVGFTEPIPSSLLTIKPGHIRSVARYGEHWRLRPLVMANILSARTKPSHPLRTAARIAPGILRDIDEVARAGGAAGHAAEDQATALEVSKTVELTYNVVSILSGFGFDTDVKQRKE